MCFQSGNTVIILSLCQLKMRILSLLYTLCWRYQSGGWRGSGTDTKSTKDVTVVLFITLVLSVIFILRACTERNGEVIFLETQFLSVCI